VTKLQLYSEPFAKTGNMAAEGFRRLLGRPTLGLLQTLIREGIQNVLDAACSDSGPTVLIRLRTLTTDQQEVLSKQVLSERPRGDSMHADIDIALAKPGLQVLELCDFGTEGLSGPTRADTSHDGDEPLNFVNFLRNVGAARDTQQGGGTYGYGKSSLYAMSSCSMIVVDSQTRCAGRSERRLMACHLGAAFDAQIDGSGRRRFTGRHWWGTLDGSDSVEPVTSETAIALSSGLGMPPRDASQTGTSILIVDPSFGNEDPRSIIDEVIETVLWNFWPRMMATTPPSRKIKVTVELEGRSIPIPEPEDFPPLDLFAAAMAVHRAGSKELRPILSLRPKKHLGNLAIQMGLRVPRRDSAMREESVIPKQACHIALMRPIELVVKYVVGDPFPDPRFEWAGVFICSDDDEVEAAFALAEPPAHDDWIPNNLPKGREKTFVRVALRQIEELAKTHANPAISASSADGRGPSLAATAAKMGSFLDRVSATGPGRPSRKLGKASSRKPLSISIPRFVGLHIDDQGKSVAKFLAELQNDASDSALYLVAEPHLVVDGGATGGDDLPGGFTLGVEQITLGERRMSPDGPWLHVGHEAGIVEILVPTVPSAAVGLKLRLHSGIPE